MTAVLLETELILLLHHVIASHSTFVKLYLESFWKNSLVRDGIIILSTWKTDPRTYLARRPLVPADTATATVGLRIIPCW